MADVLRFQLSCAGPAGPAGPAGAVVAGAAERLAAGRFPLLDLDAAVAPITAALEASTAALQHSAVLPPPLVAAGAELAAASPAERSGLVEAWLEDQPAAGPILGFWVGAASGALLEAARAGIATPDREQWAGAACPACGGFPQVSVIAPESGEFMGGSPRSLVCGRCAGWWTFPRAMCAWCGEDDPGWLVTHVTTGPAGERGPVRIDACESCRAYVKTFDLREAGGVSVVPLVDDVATVALDLWARGQDLNRPMVSFAGV